MVVDGQSDKISGLTHIDAVQSIQPGKNPLSNPSKSFPSKSFETYMKEGSGIEPAGAKGSVPSPFDLASQGKSPLGMKGPTQASILGQMSSASSVLGDLQNKMHQKNFNLRQSEKSLLRNKLTNANQSLRAVAKKVGVAGDAPVSSGNGKNPLNKFLNLLSDSQTQLFHAQSKIHELNSSGVSMNPGDLLLIQVKLAKAQQELEYSSILMSTAVSDIKTLFNIQL